MFTSRLPLPTHGHHGRYTDCTGFHLYTIVTEYDDLVSLPSAPLSCTFVEILSKKSHDSEHTLLALIYTWHAQVGYCESDS